MSEIPLEITCAEVKSQLDGDTDLLLVDCREQEEFDLVAIEGAQLLPLSVLPEQVQQLTEHRERAIVVYCHHGMRSARAANWLRGQGFAKTQSMQGGIDVWAQEIEPGMARY